MTLGHDDSTINIVMAIIIIIIIRPRTMVEAQIPQGKKQFWGDISLPTVEYRKYLACSRHSQPYSAWQQ